MKGIVSMSEQDYLIINQHCLNCQFWNGKDVCRRFPDSINKHKCDWCGEHKWSDEGMDNRRKNFPDLTEPEESTNPIVSMLNIIYETVRKK
jgi:hypothetical protein